MSKELVRDAHHMAQLLREQAWADGDEDIAAMIESLALSLAACRQAKTNAQRDNVRLATLNACQEDLIEGFAVHCHTRST